MQNIIIPIPVTQADGPVPWWAWVIIGMVCAVVIVMLAVLIRDMLRWGKER